ncbi:MAG: 30S ribosomal protein S14 [Neisseriaceae bacterium]|nr:MAG: 30S ribosomal protein S14 [Neisseriaceae bacterium]
MAKKSLIYRDVKRRRLAEKYKSKRLAIIAVINDPNATAEEKFEARLKFQSIPRNAMPVRQRRRCEITGRPRGTFRKFGLGRTKVRELAMKGEIPGVIKSSW